ncbi:hypothetical protein P7D22_19460 [Lichenihabitans sp. Uapishka_5]|uniref:hypothetical protein n=1 Tax=Lichenihabitans sp. Uapishka_5 TaxID=3037302 RepID=UPI0029E7F3B0|nr:hypothetical protein [Lichenihabitans sp. Uapishka_5]MDX7953346.1 hypothetical protein [Lichenihabitans sp. Uapishka_5]
MTASSSGPDDWANKVEDLKEQASAKAGSTFDTASNAAQDLGSRANAAASDLKGRASDHAADLKDAAAAHAADLKASVQAGSQSIRDSATSIATDLKSQAAGHVEEAKGVISSMADEARNRITGIIDQQKSLGADKLSGLSRAAHNAASDLDEQNPHVAKLVRDAAGSVDMIAGNLRSSNINDVVASVSTFARKQPVAFFAGSILAGFALARFIKSEPAPSPVGDTETSKT